MCRAHAGIFPFQKKLTLLTLIQHPDLDIFKPYSPAMILKVDQAGMDAAIIRISFPFTGGFELLLFRGPGPEISYFKSIQPVFHMVSIDNDPAMIIFPLRFGSDL